EKIVLPTVHGMKAEGRPYRGVLFVGLMIADGKARVVEYNCRFGDPECQAIMVRLKDDPLPQFLACAVDRISGAKRLERFADPSVVVVMAARGYPGEPRKGGMIGGLEEAGKTIGVTVFHAGTARKDGEIVANGGRVLNIAATGPSLRLAADAA